MKEEITRFERADNGAIDQLFFNILRHVFRKLHNRLIVTLCLLWIRLTREGYVPKRIMEPTPLGRSINQERFQPKRKETQEGSSHYLC